MRKKLFLLLFIGLIFSVGAQSVKELENQRKEALKQIETMNKMLNETKKSQRSSLNKLSILNRNIKVSKKLIEGINLEISKLDSEVNKLSRERRTLENRLGVLKKDYARMIQEAHINRGVYSKIMFVLSAETFDQSYRRIRYLQEYADFRKMQVTQIQKTTEELNKKTQELNQTKISKVEVAKSKENETQKLADVQKKENVVLSDLKKKEKKLQADVRTQQRKANELNNKIQRLIAEEIRKAEEAQKKKEPKQTATESKTEKPAKAPKSNCSSFNPYKRRGAHFR
jgi:murein hydrolase activator